MTRRAVIVIAAAAVIGAACGAPPQTTVDVGKGRELVPMVVDALDDVGIDPSIAVSREGVPYIAYFGFPEELAPGAIPITRPIGAPFVPAVLLASEHQGIVSRGAVVMSEPPPTGVNIPFGPAAEPSLAKTTPAASNGTAVVVDGQGGVHVAWVDGSGLWYGSGGGSTAFSVRPVLKLPHRLDEAGPLGPPGIALDDRGNAWIAFGDATGGSQVTRVAVQNGDRWKLEDVSRPQRCSGCSEPQRVAIGVTADGPTVIWADPASGDVVASTLRGASWSTSTVESGAGGAAISMAVDADGGAHVAYYAGRDEVHAAVSGGGSWKVTTVAKVGPAQDPRRLGTGIAVDDQGTQYVTWYDGGGDAVRLATGDDGSFSQVQLKNAVGGDSPSVGVAPDGSGPFVAWYDHINQNLVLGTVVDASELVLAEPSPTSTSGLAPSSPTGGPTTGAGGCAPKGSTATETAPTGAATGGFAQTCLAVDAGKPATVTFENQDAGTPHNWSLYEDQGYTKSIVAGNIITGPASEDVKVPSLDKATYYFRCDVHPTTMQGQLVVG